jgi:hypothetical protein
LPQGTENENSSGLDGFASSKGTPMRLVSL